MSNLNSRAEQFGWYIIENKATIRSTANFFNISKSTVHNDVSKILKHENLSLYNRVKEILEINFEERHIRGGNATKEKYLKLKNKEIL